MTDIDKKIEELNEVVEVGEREIGNIKNKMAEVKKSIKKLERIKADIAEIVL